MTGLWNPEVLNGIGVVGISVLCTAGLAVSLVRGWLVPGRIHREVVAGKDSAIENYRERAVVDAETIRIQVEQSAKRDAVEVTTTRLLTAFRDAATTATPAGDPS